MQERKGQIDHFIQKNVAFHLLFQSIFIFTQKWYASQHCFLFFLFVCLFLCIPHLIWTLLEGSEMGLLFHVTC